MSEHFLVQAAVDTITTAMTDWLTSHPRPEIGIEKWQREGEAKCEHFIALSMELKSDEAIWLIFRDHSIYLEYEVDDEWGFGPTNTIRAAMRDVLESIIYKLVYEWWDQHNAVTIGG